MKAVYCEGNMNVYAHFYAARLISDRKSSFQRFVSFGLALLVQPTLRVPQQLFNFKSPCSLQRTGFIRKQHITSNSCNDISLKSTSINLLVAKQEKSGFNESQGIKICEHT